MNPQPALSDSLLHLYNNIATLTLNRNDVRNELTGTKLVDDICTTVDWINNTLKFRRLLSPATAKPFALAATSRTYATKRACSTATLHSSATTIATAFSA